MEMAYVNVAEWSPEHVAEWLRGLEYSLVPYVQFFLNNEIGGSHLLNLTADDLEDLHIFKIGHQLLILEAVELLKQLHYSLNSETLQSLAVKLGCKARSLYNDLKLNGPQDHSENMRQERVSTNVLSAVSEVLTSVKALISWLDRLPFQHDPLCLKLKKSVLKLSIELASTTQRDQFAERPHSLIKRNSLNVAELCDKFVQDSKDSLILQPASLDIAMIKKKPEEELGIHIKSTYSGVHIIGGIKDQSPAKSCNKVEKGDEIVQVNYQTVIGWQQKKLVTAMTEHSTELHLTLKKRPRHINILGEVIILRPYRIPSKKTAKKCRNWSEDKICSPDTCSTSNESECMRDDFNEDEDDSAFLPEGANLILTNDVPLQHILYPSPASATLQRRATVSGASPTILKPPVNIEDLVNGVTCLKSLESYGRSISHDPSNHKLVPELEISLSNNPSPSCERGDKDNKEVIEGEIVESTKNAASKSLVVADFTTCFNKISNNENHSRDKSPVPVLEALPVHEEDYTILENKSLIKIDDYIVVQKELLVSVNNTVQNEMSCVNSEASVHNTGHILHPDNSSAKHNIVLYNWDGVDTEFCGRRPSAHDISNEIAGSKVHEINPVFLRRASKLESSPVSSGDIPGKESGDAGSYQVVIVAGVPQKCTPITKDGREKSKGLEFISHPYRVRESIVGKFGSRRISCKDLGKGDCEGWLYKQKERKGFFPSGHQWVKRWIVLKDHLLYSYRDENDTKAESLISLPGSTVSPTTECKTKKFVFKVCQLHVTFYFATESQKDLANWMNKMGLAAIAYDASADITTSGFSKPGVILGVANNFYSETEDSESGSPNLLRHTLSNEISPGSSSSEFSSEHNSSSRRKIKTSSFSNNRMVSSSAIYPKIKNRYSNYKELCMNEAQKYDERIERKMAESTLNDSTHLYPRDSYLKSGMRYCDYQNSKISYNRSFSSTESSYSQPKNYKSSLKKVGNENSLARQQFHEQNHHINNSSTTGCHSTVWNSVDEEYDMLTSSLGRQQRPLAKEITPGLVARMAVSYSNLSQKNATMTTSVNKKLIGNKGIPASGYVAKISDSFDHLAKIGKSSITKVNKGKKFQHVSPTNERDKIQSQQNYKYKRSASESQMSKKTLDYKHDKVILDCSTSLSLDPKFSSSDLESCQTRPEKYVSLLDKEYNKVFEGKKVSQQYLKSPTGPNDFSRQGSGRRMMRFFPNANLIESSRSLVDMQNKNLVECRNELGTMHPRMTSGSDTFRNSESTFTTESSYSLSGDVYSCHKKSASNSGSHLSDVFTSSEGIENIGFSCTDQMPIECMESKILCASKSDEQKQSAIFPISYQVNYQNKNVLTETSSSDIGSPRTSFKFFNSPKFMKKLTSPKLDKKNIFKSKKQAKELKKNEQKETSSQNDRKFFGSPILGRALFRSPKTEKKVITVSSGVQTDIPPGMPSDFNKSFHDLNRNESSAPLDRSDNFDRASESREEENITSKSSSCSSLNSMASNSISPLVNSVYYVEAKIKPQIVVTLPLAAEKQAVESRMSPSDVSRTPLKPMMGVTMLSKKRLPSISGESSVSVSSKSSQDGSTKDTTQPQAEVSMEINGDEEFLQVRETLHSINISTDDPVHISETTESCEESS